MEFKVRLFYYILIVVSLSPLCSYSLDYTFEDVVQAMIIKEDHPERFDEDFLYSNINTYQNNITAYYLVKDDDGIKHHAVGIPSIMVEYNNYFYSSYYVINPFKPNVKYDEYIIIEWMSCSFDNIDDYLITDTVSGKVVYISTNYPVEKSISQNKGCYK